MSKDVRFAPKEEQCPHHEAGTFADQHQQRRLAKIDPVKAERDGKDIADKGTPGQQGEPMWRLRRRTKRFPRPRA